MRAWLYQKQRFHPPLAPPSREGHKRIFGQNRRKTQTIWVGVAKKPPFLGSFGPIRGKKGALLRKSKDLAK